MAICLSSRHKRIIVKKILNCSSKNIVLLHQLKKKIVLVGGCFDILHIGHLKFLDDAKKKGDILVVLLEDDKNVRKLKGNGRPFFNQEERALMLTALKPVDYVLKLSDMNNDKDYEKLIMNLKPSIIAVAENDKIITKKKDQAERINSKFVKISYWQTYSTSNLAKKLGIE